MKLSPFLSKITLSSDNAWLLSHQKAMLETKVDIKQKFSLKKIV